MFIVYTFYIPGIYPVPRVYIEILDFFQVSVFLSIYPGIYMQLYTKIYRVYRFHIDSRIPQNSRRFPMISLFFSQ